MLPVTCILKAWASAESWAGANNDFFCNKIKPEQILAWFTHFSLTFRLNVLLFAFKQVAHWLVKRPLLLGAGKRSSPVVALMSIPNRWCALRCLAVSWTVGRSLHNVVSSWIDGVSAQSEGDCSIRVVSCVWWRLLIQRTVWRKDSLFSAESEEDSSIKGGMLAPSSVGRRENKLRMLAVLCITREEKQQAEANKPTSRRLKD